MYRHRDDITKVKGDARRMNCFLGEYQQVMDSKNRIFIPSKYRDMIGERVYITCNVDGCLSVYSDEGWEKYTSRLLALPSAEGSALARFIFSTAMDAKPDAQGRVVLTQSLRDFAGLTKDIYIIGVGDHAEIWDKEKRDADKTAERTSELISFMQKFNF